MSKRVKQLIIRSFVTIEIVIFTWIYCFGARGLHVVLHLRSRNKTIEATCQEYVNKIKHLEEELHDWQQHKNFYYEKYAREKLHMAHEQDQIIFI
jgi:cell division protein FtsB